MNRTDTVSLEKTTAPTSTNQRYASLDQALQAHGVPASNHEFIRRFVEKLDVIGLYGRSGYIKAVRRSHGPAIQIHSGYSTGFRSEMEILLVLGEVECAEGKRGWTVTHPGQKKQETTSGKTIKQREFEYPICMDCFMTLPATGNCDNCES